MASSVNSTELEHAAQHTGLFDEELWLEDLTVYRGGELVLGVLTHEGGGLLRASEAELQELRSVGLSDEDSLRWVHY